MIALLTKPLACFSASWKRQQVYHARQIFFDRILKRLTAPADISAIKFEQHKLLQSMAVVETLQDVSAGVLYFTIETNFSEQIGNYSYSLFITGDLFRIGLLLYGGLENAPLLDWHNEIQSLWPGSSPEQTIRQDLTLYEWTYLLPDLYSNYATQERYILGLRHMNSRVLRIIRDYRLVQQQEAQTPHQPGIHTPLP